MPKDEELPTPEEVQKVVERLGIDAGKWADEIRARVAAALSEAEETAAPEPSSDNARMDDAEKPARER